MIKSYQPTDDEVAAVKYQVYITANRDDISDQARLLGVLVKEILIFDYFYHYSDDHRVWVNAREKEEWILSHIELIEDDRIRRHLESSFTASQAKNVINPFPWGPYVYHTTKYQQFRFAGMSHDEACRGVGLVMWIDKISVALQHSGIAYRVVYSDNIPKASHLLREGYRWFDDELILPVCVPKAVYQEICKLGKLYKQKEIKYQDLKTFLGNKVNLMFDQKAEVLMINNFYMMFTYK